MNITKIAVRIPNDDPILAGRLDGKRMFLRVLEELPAFTEPTIVVLDFAGVELATSSFLSEAVPPLREHLRLRRPPAYVVAANLNAKVREELDELLIRTGDVLLTCQISSTGEVTDTQLAGTLEPKLLETLELVRRRGETSAVELHSDATDSDGIGPTGWNNRLAALASKSLILEVPQGRTKKYRPILENA
jgi:hypothetical protein